MALAEARKALEQKEVPIGAVVVAGGRVIARAHNLTETLTDPTAHAEMQAITIATDYLGGKYLTGCTLYVTVEPCPMCAAALNWAQVSKMAQTTRGGVIRSSAQTFCTPAPRSPREYWRKIVVP